MRAARPAEWEAVGALTARVFADEGWAQGDYLAVLRDVAGRAAHADVLVADGAGRLLGAVTVATRGGAFAEQAAPGEAVVRMLVVDVLEELGLMALEASDGPEGLKVLQSKARVDLLITDVGLPGGLNGRQVADAGRLARPGLKVLFITGYAENAVLGHGHLDPGMHVLTKPFAIETLASRIKDLIGGT